MTRPDVENVQPHDDETRRLTAQLLPADAVASSEARLTTRDFCHERTAGPYSPDSYSLPRLLERQYDQRRSSMKITAKLLTDV